MQTTTNSHPFPDYVNAAGSYDEITDGDGITRPHWLKYIQSSANLNSDEFSRRWTQAQRLLRENSLAYPDPVSWKAEGSPWALDALPLVIDAAEWQQVSAALKQRATLLDLLLRDIYGEQRLMREGVLPAEIIFGHPSFRLPYCNPKNSNDRQLHFYAADLARSPDGGWWVINDRSEAPSGMGFALQNRIASSQILPEVIHACQVERLAPFFLSMQKKLARLSGRGSAARIVVWSQSTGSDNYFEDAFLSRYLGYTLAEAGDLVVREQRLHLKTLGGLSPIDVLLRRPNSEDCDRLEMVTSSSLGIPGLVQSCVSGNVSIVNSLGSGLVESPIFMAFMPQICVALLGEPLAMPGVATWWCGDESSRKMVFDRLDDLIIKPAYRHRGFGHERTRDLSQMNSHDLADLIRRNPGRYVAQERVVRSSMPVWSNNRFEQSFIALRSFALAENDDYTVMQGALTRVSRSLDPLELSLLEGERSKDTWVLADRPVRPVTLLKGAEDELDIRRGGVNLPSRAAEHFFWLGRHVVRAEISGKLLQAVALRLTSEKDAEQIPELSMLMRVLAERGQIEPGFVLNEIRDQLPNMERALPNAVFTDQQPGTLKSIVNEVVFLASTVRDLMSLDSWRIIRQMNVDFWPVGKDKSLLDVLDQLESLLIQLAAFSGHVTESMTRTHAWHFLDLGRRLEYSIQIVSIIRTAVEQAKLSSHDALEALLEIFDGIMTYRSRYLTRVQLRAVLDLLIQDESNPRSLAFQLERCLLHVEQLPTTDRDEEVRAEYSLASGLLEQVLKLDITDIARDYQPHADDSLMQMLTIMEATLPELSNAISLKYFYHTDPTQHRL